MPALTAAVLAAFVAYIAAWYVDAIEGNFAFLLLVASVVTGLYWLAERFHFLPQRQAAAARLAQERIAQQESAAKAGLVLDHVDTQKAQAALLAQPWWLDWTAGLFPVIVAVFLLRSFLVEPFKIPSGSMIPTLQIGDMILVNKFHYGIRLPVINTKITAGTPVARGDVMVFRYPPKPSMDYIKRVVALPGDEVAYHNKRLSINGQPVPTQAQADFLDVSKTAYFKQFEETIDGKRIRVIHNDMRPAFVSGVLESAVKDHCSYSMEGVRCKVPAGHYFVMGDNRDDSLDSRYWGFVPDANVVGKAFFIWMNFSSPSRVGGFD